MSSHHTTSNPAGSVDLGDLARPERGDEGGSGVTRRGLLHQAGALGSAVSDGYLGTMVLAVNPASSPAGVGFGGGG
ncbi:MAG TPA: hypothetical protein VFD90_09395 [Gaiellales bacterium]|jgi:hypothetical protein|nr:hypothetical protein [Gaiellales bacterium]